MRKKLFIPGIIMVVIGAVFMYLFGAGVGSGVVTVGFCMGSAFVIPGVILMVLGLRKKSY